MTRLSKLATHLLLPLLFLRGDLHLLLPLLLPREDLLTTFLLYLRTQTTLLLSGQNPRKETTYAVFSDEGDDLTMPPMVDLASQGLRRSPRLVTQELKNYACSMLKKICAFGMVLAVVLSQPLNVSSHAHACVKSSVFQCATVNAKFDQTLNSIHHMILAARQTNNEVYTFKDMLKEDDRA